MRQTTLKEHGGQLLFGVPQDGELNKAWSCRPYRGSTDRALGVWRSTEAKHYDGRELIYKEVERLAGLLLRTFGSHEFSLVEKPEENILDVSPESLAVLHQANMADVLYAYVYARRQVLGSEYKFAVRCPNCKWEGTPIFDLDSLKVYVADSPEDLVRWVTLADPFPLRDNKGMCESVMLRPIPWSMMADPGMSLNMEAGTFGLYTAQRTVCAVNRDTQHYTLLPREVDEISKHDLLQIERVADQWRGIDIRVDVDCPGSKDGKPCGNKLFGPLDWSVENFFGDSIPMRET